MKRRITFLHQSDDLFNPQQLDVTKDALQVKSLKAAREERWTTSLSELPQEVRLALKQLYELRIRWDSPGSHYTSAPFVSSIPSGFHVLLTPHKGRSSDLICPLLSKVFGGNLNCTQPEDVFTRVSITAERFASSASLQYYDHPPLRQHPPATPISSFVDYLVEKVCAKDQDFPCQKYASSLESAKSIDIDYDTISQSLSLCAFYQPVSKPIGWNERIENPKGSAKVEIGVLAQEKSLNAREMSLGGYLMTLGEDTKAKPTLFSFPSRHHLSQSNFTTSFTLPTGLHPTLRLTFPSSTPPPFQACALHAYLTLPSSLFPDKYQLSQTNLLKSHGLAALRSLSPTAPDFEAPVWAIKEWGSTLLLELAPPPSPFVSAIKEDPGPKDESTNTNWHAEIPLHVRYFPPTYQSCTAVSIPNPIVFWACPSSHADGPEFNTNPFDRTNLGYDGLFDSRTVFSHLRDVSDSVVTNDGNDNFVGQQQQHQKRGKMQVINVPVLDMRSARWVEAGTGLAVLVGCGWVVCCLLFAVLGRSRRRLGLSQGKKVD